MNGFGGGALKDPRGKPTRENRIQTETGWKNFSVGERQLVCLARILVQKIKIIIKDEPTTNVDFKAGCLIQEVIRH